MTHSNKSISPLRQRMIDDMTLRKLSPKTQSGYIRAVKKLSCFLGRSPATATAEDLRLFQLHLVELGVSSITLNATITGLRFFFEETLDHHDVLTKMSHVYESRKLPLISRHTPSLNFNSRYSGSRPQPVVRFQVFYGNVDPMQLPRNEYLRFLAQNRKNSPCNKVKRLTTPSGVVAWIQVDSLNF